MDPVESKNRTTHYITVDIAAKQDKPALDL